MMKQWEASSNGDWNRLVYCEELGAAGSFASVLVADPSLATIVLYNDIRKHRVYTQRRLHCITLEQMLQKNFRGRVLPETG